MTLSRKSWENYIMTLRDISEEAAIKLVQYQNTHNIFSGTIDEITVNEEELKPFIDYAYAIVSKYGEASASLAAEMYDLTAELEGVMLPPAELPELANYGDVAKAINGTIKTSQNADEIAGAATRWVKMAASDTTLHNAMRDGAQFAWIPFGDTCPFCLMLASRGWQYMSKKALKGGHAEHIHSNCDCQYTIRHDSRTTVAGYDPDKYLSMYRNAEGSTPQERINSMRREMRAAEQERLSLSNLNIVNLNALDAPGYVEKFQNITGNEEVDTKIYEYSRTILEHRNGTDYEDLYLIDGKTGSTIYQLNTSDISHGVRYNEEIESAILQAHADGKEIIAIHNHPNGLPPTMDDGVSAHDRGYSMGIAVGHNLEVYTYTATNNSYTKEECQEVHDAINEVLQFSVEPDDNIWYSTLERYGMEVKRK